jgi:hypothetical protein
MMNVILLEKINRDFPESEFEIVVSELMSVTHEHVMAKSQSNLDNVWSSILLLSKGNISEIRWLVEAAKK